MKRPIVKLSLPAAAALFVLAIAAPLTAAAGPEVRAAPLNPAFLQSLVGAPVGAPSSTTGGHGLGDVPSPLDLSYTRGMQVPPARELGTPPASYDLRSLGKITSVKDQDPYGTCWAFASLGSLESCLLPGETWDFSEDNMVLTSGFDNGGDPYNAGGSIPKSTAYLARWGGPVNESEDAYGDSSTPPGLTPTKHVQEIGWIPIRGSSLDNDNVKNAVMEYGGVCAPMSWPGSTTGDSSYNAATASYYYNGAAANDHAVLIVGWDDNYPAANFATTPPGDGAFIAKNSWGTGWGSNGYFYVSYYDSMFGRARSMAVFNKAESTSNYIGIYQYDPLGEVDALGINSSPTGWFANVFTATATASLGGVGFYTTVPGASYEVYSGSSLGATTLRTSGTLDYMGYHTVTLPSPMGVTNGEQFVVAVKMTSPGYNYPIAYEEPIAGYSSAATAQAGQSYVSSTGSSWKDLTTYAGFAEANVCLKAYVTPFVAQPPAITAFTPTSGPVGTSVTLTGSNLTGATKVTFHGVSAIFSVDSATRITATVPPGATSGPIAVTTPVDTATTSESFTVTAPAFTPKVTLKLSGLKRGVLKRGKSVTAKGTVTPTGLSGSTVMLTVQKKRGARWVKTKTAATTIRVTNTYSWRYKATTKGAYRVRATIAKTAAHTAAKSAWRSFRVK